MGVAEQRERLVAVAAVLVACRDADLGSGQPIGIRALRPLPQIDKSVRGSGYDALRRSSVRLPANEELRRQLLVDRDAAHGSLIGRSAEQKLREACNLHRLQARL